MFKAWLSGIFGYFFIRASLAIFAFPMLLLFVLFPFFKAHFFEIVKTQGATFANTTIAAISSNLYKKEFGDALKYVQTALKSTPDILFVVISDKEGNETTISASKWSLLKNELDFSKTSFASSNNVLVYSNTPKLSPNKVFIYHQRIDIAEIPWGVLSVGISDRQYQAILSRYMFAVGSISLLLILALLATFYANAKKVRTQIQSLSNTAIKLQDGNLNAQAPEYALGEIGLVSSAVNKMSSALKEQSNRLFQFTQIVEQTNEAFILFNVSKHIIFANDAIEQLTGHTSQSFNQLSAYALAKRFGIGYEFLNDEFESILYDEHPLSAKDIVISHKNAEPIHVELRLESIFNSHNQEQLFLMVLSDITKRKTLEHELHELAFFDKLTGLPNRRMFMDHLNLLIESAQTSKKQFSLLFMDLDDFKNINDGLGHAAGDMVLTQIGAKLKQLFRKDDLITRLGGDEFTITIEANHDDDLLKTSKLAKKVLDQLSSTQFSILGRNIHVNTSIGIAHFPQHGDNADALVKHADLAMYEAKKSGKNRFKVFSDQMNVTLRKQLELESDIKEALRNGKEITLHYQPIVHLQTNQIVGAEALARWQHPTKGRISPVEFIRICELSDLIVELSDQLLKIGFKQAHEWAQSSDSFYVSINISGKQFEQSDFIDKLSALLKEYAVSSHHIQLEFTESIMLHSDDATIHKFHQIKKLGFKIAIDDFGTGYSSLGYLHKLPVDTIKIDRSFVANMINNDKAQKIVAAISSLTHSLGINTIAEGIELAEHRGQLIDYQCEFGQGYFYNKALTHSQFNQAYLSYIV